MYSFNPSGVCAQRISFDINDGLLSGIKFEGGCPGNTQGVAVLAEGRPAAEVADALRGLLCGRRGTSCPAQLARAIDAALADGA